MKKIKSMEFDIVKDGEWVAPIRKGYVMECCDCGLRHKFNFKLVKTYRGNQILFQAFRLKSKKKK